MSKVLAVIPTYLTEGRDVEVALAAVRTLSETSDAEILVVDDHSPNDQLVAALVGAAVNAGVELELVRKDENSGFSKTVNVGLRRALGNGQDAVLVNADVEFDAAGWLDAMTATRTQDDSAPASVVGGLLLYPHGLIQHAGVYYSLLTRTFGHIYQFAPGDLPEAHHRRRCPVTGALQFIRHECLTEIGIYDEAFSMGWEDVDYCLRVFQSGRECMYQPDARAWHYESLFRGRPSPKVADWQRRSFIYLFKKWQGFNFAPFVPSLI